MNLILSPKPMTWALIAVAVILTLLGLLGVFQIWDSRFLVFSAMFEVNSESTVSTWYGAFLLGLAALLCGLITVDQTRRQQPFIRRWGYLSLILLLMSIDEIALIHERLLNYVGGSTGAHGSGVFYYAWVIPGVVIVFFFALFYLPFFWNLPRRESLQLIAGFGLFFFGAVGMEMVTGWIITELNVQTIWVVMLSTIEELCEMLGVIIIIQALLNYLGAFCVVRVTFEPAAEQASVEAEQWVPLTQPE